jgi:hypothetical protein
LRQGPEGSLVLSAHSFSVRKAGLFAKQVFPRLIKPGEMTLAAGRFPFLSVGCGSASVISKVVQVLQQCYLSNFRPFVGPGGDVPSQRCGRALLTTRQILASRPDQLHVVIHFNFDRMPRLLISSQEWASGSKYHTRKIHYPWVVLCMPFQIMIKNTATYPHASIVNSKY